MKSAGSCDRSPPHCPVDGMIRPSISGLSARPGPPRLSPPTRDAAHAHPTPGRCRLRPDGHRDVDDRAPRATMDPLRGPTDAPLRRDGLSMAHGPAPRLDYDAAIVPVAGQRVEPIVSIRNVSKTYASGQVALKHVDLDIRRGEIFALLGPNGAGKTTLISIICGIVTASSGTVLADGHDIVRDYRAARSRIGLVPQELSTDAFETVWATMRFSRGLFGKQPDPAHLEKVLRDLSLWSK